MPKFLQLGDFFPQAAQIVHVAVIPSERDDRDVLFRATPQQVQGNAEEFADGVVQGAVDVGPGLAAPRAGPAGTGGPPDS